MTGRLTPCDDPRKDGAYSFQGDLFLTRKCCCDPILDLALIPSPGEEDGGTDYLQTTYHHIIMTLHSHVGIGGTRSQA